MVAGAEYTPHAIARMEAKRRSPKTGRSAFTLDRHLLLDVAVLLCQRSNVVHQVPILFGLDARTFGGHIVVTVLDDVEDLAIGAVLERGRIGEVGDLQFHVFGCLAFAIPVLAMTHFAIQSPPFLRARQRLRAGFHRVGLLGRFDRNGRVSWRFLYSGRIRRLLGKNDGGEKDNYWKHQCKSVHRDLLWDKECLQENCSTADQPGLAPGVKADRN